ncbi:MAG: exosortase Q [Proteobacteria bacterium]|nr:exosortase Q [Pseudomonadota bacterium]
MTLTALAQRHPRLFDELIRIDRAPAIGWLALQAAALMSTWWWMARRMVDGSDDPLGVLALGALVVLVWCMRAELRCAPRLGWLACASVGTLAATVMRTGIGPLTALPPLFAALVALLALAAGVMAVMPRRVAAAPVLGLAVLALPILSSLQFYAGFPLRVVTAEASRWLLAPFFEVQREAASLIVDGRLVIVDAPCSGVQMAWCGYFVACVVALWAGRGNRGFLTRLPWVGLVVLGANVLRNSVLVAFEGAGLPPGDAWHQAVGLAVLAAACAEIAWLMAPLRRRRATASPATRTAAAA